MIHGRLKLLLLFFGCFGFVLDVQAEQKHNQVLMITSYHHGDAWNDGVVQGVRDILDELDHLDLAIEHLDMRRNTGEAYEQWVTDFFWNKYRRSPKDLIIVSDDDALDFLLRIRSDLFTDIPVVFCGINNFTPDRIADHSNITGVNEEVSIARNIELGLQLFPWAKAIYAVVDEQSSVGKVNLEIYRAAMENPDYLVSLKKLVDLKVHDARDILGSLPENSLVLRLSNILDGRGGYLSIAESMDLISQASSVPVISFWDFDLGHGALGGYLINAREQGRTAGKLASMILKGKHPHDISVIMQSPNLPMFDYQQMQIFGLKTTSLPENSIIINLPETFYDRHKTIIWPAAVIIAFLIVCVAALLLILFVRRKAQDQLRKLSRVVEQSPASVLMTDLKGNIEYANPTFTNVTGYTFDEVKGQNPRILKSPDTNPEIHSELWKTITSGNEWRGEFKNIKKNGDIFWESASIGPIFNEQGKITHYLAVKEDITERKKIEDALLAAKEQAETASIAKSQFLANMSHELRTPFNGIMGMMQLLQTTDLNREQQEYADAAIKSSRRFARLLSDILDLSSIQAGNMVVCNARFDVKELMESVVGLFSAQARQKSVTLEYLIDTGVPVQVMGDVAKVKQILFNLVGNALKFCEHGGVQVRLSLLSPGKGQDLRIMFSISDSGIGIPEDKLRELFNPFVQGDCSYTREHQGAGLGLTLVKEMVDLMNGNISVESKVGMGTAVHVVLPFELPVSKKTEPSEISAMPENGKKHLDILLAEDDELNQMFMIYLLEKLDHSVTLARNGQEAVELYQKHDFDCILMDIQMPVMTGDEATKRIRRLEKENSGILASWDTGIEKSEGKTGMIGQAEQSEAVPGSEIQASQHSRIPIIAVTAHTQPGDRERFLAEGMDDYLGKPVNVDDLKEKLDKVPRKSAPKLIE
ncbi:MAG: PAS domain S-box protein [Desulfonatronovibrio sp. MSAO_Bac4]|nr:MAG: PAS domain S-box protein [Desulfonatronovibrio sp. MSAO_Bac4]